MKLLPFENSTNKLSSYFVSRVVRGSERIENNKTLVALAFTEADRLTVTFHKYHEFFIMFDLCLLQAWKVIENINWK